VLRAAAFFATHGIDQIERVTTDNAKNHTISTHFQAALGEFRAKHKLIRPHCPWQAGRQRSGRAPCDGTRRGTYSA